MSDKTLTGHFVTIWQCIIFSWVIIISSGCSGILRPVSSAKSGEILAHGETFGYRRWVAPGVPPDVVIIGIHGFCGASTDYTNLGNFLLNNQPTTGLYAYEVRGQGSDPIAQRRGDIGDPKDWYHDLASFTQLVRDRHPHAKIVWFGESMGGLIAAHALQESAAEKPPCDALVLSSPVVRFKKEIPYWQVGLLRIAATALPLVRVSTETLTGSQDIQMTQTSHHETQVKKNAYNIEKHTLRLLGTLARHINTMNDCAEKFSVPVLVLHGGKDFLNNDSDCRGFVAHINPRVSVTYKNYPGAYHLLMYDAEKGKIFGDIARWLKKLKTRKLR